MERMRDDMRRAAALSSGVSVSEMREAEERAKAAAASKRKTLGQSIRDLTRGGAGGGVARPTTVTEGNGGGAARVVVGAAGAAGAGAEEPIS